MNACPTPTRADVNRANSLFSTGPKSPEGKAKSSVNAVKTALTGKTVLLSSDDAAQYELHVRRFFDQHQPAGDRECELVQTLADTQWRLNRIPALEMNIYALGRLQFANQFVLQDPDVAAGLIEAHVFLTYQKQLNNLSIQENRLRRNFQKDSAELAQLQKERRERERKPAPAVSASAPVTSRNGFEFSTSAANARTEPDASAPSTEVQRTGTN